MSTGNENLIPSCASSEWTTWSTETRRQPVFEKNEGSEQTTLIISGKPDEKCVGKWISKVNGIKGSSTYHFSVEYLAINVRSESVSVSAILSWMNAEDVILTRDYVDGVIKTSDNWTQLSRTLEIHPDARSVRVELMARWIPGGTVEWRNPFLAETAPLPHRIVKVATTFHEPRTSTDENLATMLQAMDEAAQQNADIILFTELYYTRDQEGTKEELYETIPGKHVNVIAEKAKQHKMYAIINLGEKDDGNYFNTAVLIDRNGEIAGTYRKTHLPLFESEWSNQPADDYPVFDTDFGRIAIMICWDQWFPEVARILRLKGAQMIFVPTAGDAHVLSQARAVENGVHLVISGGTNGEMRSRIINPMGEITGGIYESDEGVYVESIDMDKKYYTFWLSVGPCFAEGPTVYMKERRPDTYSLITTDVKD